MTRKDIRTTRSVPNTTHPSARRTNGLRLTAVSAGIALALSGSLAPRPAEAFGFSVFNPANWVKSGIGMMHGMFDMMGVGMDMFVGSMEIMGKSMQVMIDLSMAWPIRRMPSPPTPTRPRMRTVTGSETPIPTMTTTA